MRMRIFLARGFLILLSFGCPMTLAAADVDDHSSSKWFLVSKIEDEEEYPDSSDTRVVPVAEALDDARKSAVLIKPVTADVAPSDMLVATPEERLYRYLFGRGYLKHVRPAVDPFHPIIINVGMCVMMIEDLIERDQMMIMAACVKMIWTDPRLQWDPARFNNLTWITISSQKIWFPDIVIVNSPDPSGLTRKITSVGLSNNGEIGFYPSGRLFTRCNLIITYFPFDWQHCEVRFESWIYPVEFIQLTSLHTGNDTITVKEHYANYQWMIKGHRIISDVAVYDGQNFSSITIIFIFQRKSLYFTLYYIFPELLLAVLQSLSHTLPVEHPGRMTMLTALFIGTTVTHSGIASHTPKSSDTMSLLQIYMTIMSINLVFSLLISFLMLYTVLRYPHVEPSIIAMFANFLKIVWPKERDTSSLPSGQSKVIVATGKTPSLVVHLESRLPSPPPQKERISSAAGARRFLRNTSGINIPSGVIEPISPNCELDEQIGQGYEPVIFGSEISDNNNKGSDSSLLIPMTMPKLQSMPAHIDTSTTNGKSSSSLLQRRLRPLPATVQNLSSQLTPLSCNTSPWQQRAMAERSPTLRRSSTDNFNRQQRRQRVESMRCEADYVEMPVSPIQHIIVPRTREERKSQQIAEAESHELKRRWLIYCVAFDKVILYAIGVYNFVVPFILFGIVPFVNEKFFLPRDDYTPYHP